MLRDTVITLSDTADTGLFSRVPQFLHQYCDKYTLFKEGAFSLLKATTDAFIHFLIIFACDCLNVWL